VALTTTGRAGIARRCGSGKRDEKVYERNQCRRSVSDEPAPIWWIWAGVQCVIAGMGGRSTPKPGSFAGGGPW
jgi:hypothetical protein